MLTASSSSLLPRYGPGPHRVKMLVEFTKSKRQGSFVIDLASDLMPHSSKLFLDQVKLGLWDKTVFWHHDGVDHVISSAAVSYKTGESRFHHFGALGVGGVSFGEYSDQMPHELWTVGFSGKGPEFYINSADNTKLHGPGGNAHVSNAADEGDPCFGKIVEGLSVVKEMYQLSEKQSKLAAKRKDWHDNELTHILKAEVLTSN
jgi:cyclophilin family peptidyl-prolyl cis-trans isomerase